LGLKPTASSEGANFTLEDFGYYVDNPAKWGNTDWAKQKQAVAEKYAREGGKSAQKLLSGPQTAFLGIDSKKPLYLDTDFLSTLKGANDEVTDMSNPKYVDLKKSVEEEGFLPDQKGNKILIGINHKGEAFIMEGNNRVAIAKEFGAPSVKAEVKYYNGAEEVDGPYSPQNILKYASQAPRQFAEGGTVDMNQQMSFAFEDGGLRDDGMRQDPVSGNEVPSGSMAKEVRDDIPAQLSEGEYVVPADVVRYYGVKFFEDLRNRAKMGLQDMEARGRIGGEPVPAGGPQNEDLSPEEMAMIREAMGMSQGGQVPGYNQGGSQPNPTSGQVEQNFLTLGQAAQQNPYMGQPLGFSFAKPAPAPAAAPVAPVTQTQQPQRQFPINMLDPTTGNIVPATNEEQYQNLLSQGYIVAPKPTGGDGGSTTPPPIKTEPWKDWVAATDWTSEDSIKKFVNELEEPISKEEANRKAIAAGILGGPAAGLATGLGASRGGLQNISDLNAARLIAKAQGMNDLAAELDARVKTMIEEGPGILDFLDDIFATGKQKANAWAKTQGFESIEAATKAGVTPKPPVTTKTTPAQTAAKKAVSGYEGLKKPSGGGDDDPFPTVVTDKSIAETKAIMDKQTSDTIEDTTQNLERTTAKIEDIQSGKNTSGQVGFNKGGLMATKPKRKTKRQYNKGGLAGKKK
jgi:hypothetical protein